MAGIDTAYPDLESTVLGHQTAVKKIDQFILSTPYLARYLHLVDGKILAGKDSLLATCTCIRIADEKTTRNRGINFSDVAAVDADVDIQVDAVGVILRRKSIEGPDCGRKRIATDIAPVGEHFSYVRALFGEFPGRFVFCIPFAVAETKAAIFWNAGHKQALGLAQRVVDFSGIGCPRVVGEHAMLVPAIGLGKGFENRTGNINDERLVSPPYRQCDFCPGLSLK